MNFKDYYKLVGAFIVTALTAYSAAYDSGSDVSNSEWIGIAVAVAGSSAAVWYVTNGPGGIYAKAIFASVTAAGASAMLALQDEILTQTEFITIVIAALGGLGLVAVLPGPKEPPA